MGKKASSANEEQANLTWWQLSLIGVGCTIGTGFFLASGIAIKMTGPSVIIAFIMAATATYLVFEALAKMIASDPQKGSFRTYAKKHMDVGRVLVAVGFTGVQKS